MPQVDFFAMSEIRIITMLIGVDVIVGILGAIVKKEFRFGKLGKFMHAGVLPYVFGFVVLKMVTESFPSLGFALPFAYVLIILTLVGSLIRNLHKLGLPLPGSDWV